MDQTKSNLNRLRYGFRAKIFKSSRISEASIYLDTLYDNFLWIATDQNTFIVDLCFSVISFYSLELELEIKHQSKYSQEAKKKYILLKQLNTQIPIIFNEQKIIEFSSEQDMNEFEKGRRPFIFSIFEKYIEEKKFSCKYSANFSRCFKKMRLQLQTIQKQSFTQFSQAQVSAVMSSISDFDSVQKASLIQMEKKYSSKDLFELLKAFYCKRNVSVLKSIGANKGGSGINQSNMVSRNNEEDFGILMEIENSTRNYIIADHTVDQNLPLTDYFCFSSHNTYLTGNQITSDCKITRYIEDLKKGIKCVQLDVHNEGNNEPVITHAVSGKGFCKPISFRDTIEAIDEFLQYNKNHYPIILSIQNHASRQNQDLMNNILRKQFPKNILIPSDRNEFYKLSETRGKIIVKTSCNLESLIQFRNNSENPKTKGEDLNSFANVFSVSSQKTGPALSSSAFTFSDQLITNTNENQSDFPQTQNTEYKAFLQRIKKYKDLKVKFNQKIDQNSYLPVQKIVQITCLFKAPKGIETPKTSPFECSSMQNAKITKTPKQKIVNYTKQSWLRSYPEGTQIYSNNYDFLELLARGVQIIALNTQTNDDYAIMLNSYFRTGRQKNMGNLGYIEKPEYLRMVKGTQGTINYPQKKNYEWAFYTSLQLQFTLYSLQSAKIEQINVMQGVKRIRFQLKNFNQSFLIIKIANQKWIQCLPLRFLPYDQTKKIYRTIIGRDYEFQDTGIRIICSFSCS